MELTVRGVRVAAWAAMLSVRVAAGAGVSLTASGAMVVWSWPAAANVGKMAAGAIVHGAAAKISGRLPRGGGNGG